MGFLLTQKIIRASVGLSSTEKLVLISVADRVDTKGYSFPSIGLIAKEVGVGKRTIYRTIDKLERGGFLQIRRIIGQSNRYSVLESALIIPKGGDTHDTPTPDTGDTPPLTFTTLGSVTDVTLIDKPTDKLIDKGNRTGSLPLKHILSYLPIEVGEGKKIKNVELQINNSEGSVKMNTLDSIQSAIDGTGLKQKKTPDPKSLWRKAVAEWMLEQEISDGMINVTKVDAGKLNLAAKKIGSKFPSAVKTCIEHWNAYTGYVSNACGYSGYAPEQPSINFFIKHINEATTFNPSTKYTSDIKCNNKDILD